MSRRRRAAVAILSALALAAACEVAHAEPSDGAVADAKAPLYTLEVDSDDPDVISYEALAARIGPDLGAAVARPGALLPSRAAIAIQYRGRELTVRAVHSGGRTLERRVTAEGDDAAVQREAVLLAANLARDEAREILDALAARAARPAVAPAQASEAAPAPKRASDGKVPVSVAFFYPLATNFGRPNVGSSFDFSLLYGRVGTIRGVELGSGAMYAAREVEGAQVAGFGAASGGAVSGAQVSGAGNIAWGPVTGAQVSGGANLALAGFSGAQLAGAVNVARGGVRGAAIAGGANVATGEVIGAQIAPVNVAESVDGVQLGVVNVARKVRGVQLGVINVADKVDGASVGLVSVTREGVHPIVWGSNLEYMNAGVKFSTKYVYTITAVHYGTFETGWNNFGTTAVLGGRIPLVAGLDLEVQNALTHMQPRPSERSIGKKEGNLWVAPQAVVGYSFAPHLRLFAGGGARLPLMVDIGREATRPEVLAGVQF